MKRILLMMMISLTACTAFTQNSDSIMVNKIVDETMINGTAYENLRILCKQVGARLSGSPQYLKAVALTTKMMKAIGVDTVYLQQCMVTRWVRGEKEKGKIIFSS